MQELRHGKILLLPEIPTMSKPGDTIRTYGRICSWQDNQVDITHDHQRMRIDVSLVDLEEGFEINAFYMFIGVIESLDEEHLHVLPSMQARVASSIDGVDQSLLERMIKARRQFEENMPLCTEYKQS
eukprot:gb/GECH01001964.1/.p1 GENE.gb/GECH01001964.1/~~gb/GECH01001964.1/.p1  ORF type:complete len:127 (+),score=37.58 gb/GECH01001964.1/:1-381(+)